MNPPEIRIVKEMNEDEFDWLIYQNNKLSCRPCTKIGLSRCPLKHFNCMNQIKFEDVIL